MNVTETASAIREELKTLGLGTKHVSVRAGSNNVNVVIKSDGVDVIRVKRIARSYSHTNRCEFSGDILLGNNLSVSVSVARKAYSVRAMKLQPRIEELKGNDTIKIGPFEVSEYYRGGVEVWERKRHGNCFQTCNAKAAAVEIAKRLNQYDDKQIEAIDAAFTKTEERYITAASDQVPLESL